MESSFNLNDQNKEVLIATDIFGQSWNISVVDYITGTILLNYKNTSTVPHGLSFIKDSYMVSAIYNKPYLLYWNLKGKSSQPAKINTPGFVSCLDVSSCGNYIAIGIEEKVFLLQVKIYFPKIYG